MRRLCEYAIVDWQAERHRSCTRSLGHCVSQQAALC